MSEPQFMERLRIGDDFAAWCVRFGIPVRLSAVWNRIVESSEAKGWPDWRQKIEHAARRLLLADQLLKLQDEERRLSHQLPDERGARALVARDELARRRSRSPQEQIASIGCSIKWKK
jgi:hypothetical protein